MCPRSFFAQRATESRVALSREKNTSLVPCRVRSDLVHHVTYPHGSCSHVLHGVYHYLAVRREFRVLALSSYRSKISEHRGPLTRNFPDDLDRSCSSSTLPVGPGLPEGSTHARFANRPIC